MTSLPLIHSKHASTEARDELPASLQYVGNRIESLYFHVPFCSSKCHYCDFYSLAGHLDRADAFLAALEREIILHRAHFGQMTPRTIFIGGGTPTLLSPVQLAQLLQLIQTHFDFARLVEFTVEANPNTFDVEKAKILAAHGVNRISFGAQSFNRDELATLQRDHDPESVALAFAVAREAGIGNLNIDLIFGIPGQTLASWEYSLTQALALQPSHMSCYSLIYETNTAMTARLQRGEFQKIDEELELQLFEHVYRRLRDAGFERYETSNYARAGNVPLVCQHNLVYWKAGNWLGLGPSAGSHIATFNAAEDEPAVYQWKNAGSLAHYLEALGGENPRVPVTQMESLSRRTWTAAAAAFWLRVAEGLDFSAFKNTTGVDIRDRLLLALKPFSGLGLVETTAQVARITEKGVAVSDHILSRVLKTLEAPEGVERH